MEWHNERLLPVGLPELAYQVTPPEVADYLRVIAMPKRKKRCLASVRCHICDSNKLVEPAIMIINVNAVINDVIGSRSDVVTTAIWLRFLRTFLHEVGHVVNLLDNRDPKVGGQFTLSDVARFLRVNRNRVKKMVHALGIGRVYVDGADRKHLFFAWSDIQKIIIAAKNSY
ncbi:MAG: hypothetical protein K6U04_08720 [Armatimonadetes bacterium]|nr:hypothetical protein [Armatimonadota bacterium]